MLFRALLALLLTVGFRAARAADSARAQPFRTFLVTRSMAHERLIPYLEAARPEVVQIGQYGAMFHGYADDPKSRTTPMHLPFTGERKVLAHQRELNRKIHDLGLKVVGHFRLVKAFGNWDRRSGFVDYYDRRWPEDLLGPKPHPRLIELLQRDAGGKPVQTSRYEQDQLSFCLSSPFARQMFKQMLKVAIDHGVDGIITTFNYHFHCACPHCQTSFRNWLGRQLSAAELRGKLGIEDLANHVFETIPARIGDFPDAGADAPLGWLATRWAAENFKENFDDIFVRHGRSLKPDLLIAQWNHLGHVNAGEERMFLPLDRWGRGESYFWESGGAAFVGKNLSLAEGRAGDAWLSCLVVRELGGGKPFVMGKYDGIRMAASMAEGFATGGLGMGRYMRFEEPEGFDTLVRHTRFMHEHRGLYDGAESLAETAIILPRVSLWGGYPGPIDDFREFGQALLNRQVPLDVIADEGLTLERLKRYRTVIVPRGAYLPENQLKALKEFKATGHLVIDRDKATDTKAVVEAVRQRGTLRIDAPWTVRVSAYRQGAQRMLLHLVNYNRDEGTTKAERASKPENERPVAVENIAIRLASDARPTGINLHQPEHNMPISVPFDFTRSEVRFTIPRLLVYGVVEVVFK